jgi:hypothetical protein
MTSDYYTKKSPAKNRFFQASEENLWELKIYPIDLQLSYFLKGVATRACMIAMANDRNKTCTVL